MREITVSTDVYAAIWGARSPGEDSEDAILRRLLSVAVPEPKEKPSQGVGFRDLKFDVVLPEGFEIYRTYKGTTFTARATGGRLVLANDGRAYDSLNKLSRAASGNIENAWRNWYFRGPNGHRYRIDSLRADVTPNVRHLLSEMSR